MDPSEWAYLAEGGANIVFRYIGSKNNFKNKVLRIRKRAPRSLHPLIPFLPLYYDFICHRLNMLDSVGMISFVDVSENFLQELDQSSFSKRPEYRRLKAGIDTSLNTGLLIPDLFTEYFSCEIKPKWSGLKHCHFSSECCKCRYCQAQIVKGRHNQVDKTPVYCPKLLFSSEESRIALAVADLFENPSNQFKLFVDSVMIRPDCLSEFKCHIAPIVINIIAKDEFFQKFINFQFQLLDGIDIDIIDINAINSEEYESDIKKLFLADSISDIPDYMRILMAMSIRDSSFVISIAPVEKYLDWKVMNVDNNIYSYKINIIDLDIKPIENISKYIEEIKVHG